MKDTFIKMEKQSTSWEKAFANYISDKVLAFQLYKEFSKLNKKKTNSSISNVIKSPEQKLYQRRYMDGLGSCKMVFQRCPHSNPKNL